MYIAQFMTKTVITITPSTSIEAATATLAAHGFRHLPVIDTTGKLVGIVTDRDLRSASPSSVASETARNTLAGQLKNTAVERIMSKPKGSLQPYSTLDDALLLFDHYKVGALPVLRDQQIIGIFSIRDLMQAYKNIFGLGEKGSVLIAVRFNQNKTISSLIEVLEKNTISCSRLVVSRSENSERIIYLRLNTFNLSKVHDVLTKGGFQLLLPEKN